MTKMLVIAPYKGLGDLFYNVNETLMKNIDIEVGNLYKGVMIAKQLESNGYDVVISRGATARVIREQTNLPVVDLQISGYDILRTLSLVKGYSGKVGVMSYLNIVQGTDVVGKLLGIDVQTFPINSEEEIETIIQKARINGIQMIIGDVITTSVAEHYGMTSVLITSGKEAVLDSIERAEEIAYYTKKERLQKHIYKSVIQKSEDGIIIVDEHSVCHEMNDHAAKFLDVNKENLVGERLNNDIPFLNFKQVLNMEKEENFSNVIIGNYVLDIEKFPIVDNGVLLGAALFLKRSKTTNHTSSIVTQENVAHAQFTHLVANSEEMKKVVHSAKRISKSDLPITIIGEKGSGKKSLAQAIHNESSRKDHPFYRINCRSYKIDQLEEIIFGTSGMDAKKSAFELADKGTLCLENILELPYHLQDRLSDCLRTQCIKRGNIEFKFTIRLFTLTMDDLSLKVKQGSFSERLYKQIGGFHLIVPPLHTRKEDYEDLIRNYIASANIKIGKQIVGIDKEVMEKLYEFDWPKNVSQLKNTIEQMCFISEGPFIQLDEVSGILNGLIQEHLETSTLSIRIGTKKLDEIIEEVILQVMEEENQNQSKAAERLGINRSTLWRKLKANN
jgi:transcriptional regulator with PAS, ATPase and Fis domain